VELKLLSLVMDNFFYLFGGAVLGIIIGRSFRIRRNNLIISKINILMADSAQIKQQVADLNTKVDALQASVDAEQATIQGLLDTNAQVVTDLNAEITRLNGIIAAGGTVTPEDLQIISDGIQAATDKIATTQADIESTVA
jgi:hypothetical protein